MERQGSVSLLSAPPSFDARRINSMTATPKELASRIANAARARTDARTHGRAHAPEPGCAPMMSAQVAARYFEQLGSELCRHRAHNRGSKLRFAYTAMHGVGTPWLLRAFECFGLPPPALVEEQRLPDPTFPTVAFPNPEEGAGALELAFATAERHGATLVLANDPDADRLAVAERRPDGGPCRWRRHAIGGSCGNTRRLMS